MVETPGGFWLALLFWMTAVPESTVRLLALSRTLALSTNPSRPCAFPLVEELALALFVLFALLAFARFALLPFESPPQAAMAATSASDASSAEVRLIFL